MSIGKKLYVGFGLILGIVFLLFLGNYVAVVHEHNTKDTFFKSIEMRKAMSSLYQERMNNRLRLRNFLLNGDTKEADALMAGENNVESLINIAEEKAVAVIVPVRLLEVFVDPDAGTGASLVLWIVSSRPLT